MVLPVQKVILYPVQRILLENQNFRIVHSVDIQAAGELTSSLLANTAAMPVRVASKNHQVLSVVARLVTWYVFNFFWAFILIILFHLQLLIRLLLSSACLF